MSWWQLMIWRKCGFNLWRRISGCDGWLARLLQENKHTAGKATCCWATDKVITYVSTLVERKAGNCFMKCFYEVLRKYDEQCQFRWARNTRDVRNFYFRGISDRSTMYVQPVSHSIQCQLIGASISPFHAHWPTVVFVEKLRKNVCLKAVKYHLEKSKDDNCKHRFVTPSS